MSSTNSKSLLSTPASPADKGGGVDGVSSKSGEKPEGEADTKVGMTNEKNRLVWNKSTETMIAGWTDIAQCFQNLHHASCRKYQSIDFCFSVPISIFSTLTGVVSVGLSGLVPPDYVDLGQKVVGGVNILTGILTYFSSKYKFSQQAEDHRRASVGWGKLARNMKITLQIERHKRADADSFIKVCRNEYDRLIESSAEIPVDIVNDFKSKFSKIPELILPDVCDNLNHTIVQEPEPVIEPVMPIIEPPIPSNVELVMNEIKQLLESRINTKEYEPPPPQPLANFTSYHHPTSTQRKNTLIPDVISTEVKPRPSFIGVPPPLIKLNSQVEVSRPSVRDLKRVFEHSFKPVLSSTSENIRPSVSSLTGPTGATGASGNSFNSSGPTGSSPLEFTTTELQIVIEDTPDSPIYNDGDTRQSTPELAQRTIRDEIKPLSYNSLTPFTYTPIVQTKDSQRKESKDSLSAPVFHYLNPSEGE